MVVKPGPLLAVSAVALLTLSAAAAAGYAPAQPDPLAQQGLLRVMDVAATGTSKTSGPVVAVGWRQAAAPGELYIAFSTDGGRTYLKQDGTMRSFRVAGDGTRGMSLDICAGSIWAATAATFPADDPAHRDVLLTSRTLDGKPGQAFLTDAAADRVVTSVSAACIGNRLLAVAWLEQRDAKSSAKLMLRSLEAAGEPTTYRRVFGLGVANRKGGISVDASTTSVQVAWIAGDERDLHFQRFAVGEGKAPDVTRQESQRLARGDARFPQVGARGQHAVVAYSDAGRVRAVLSDDDGVTFGTPAKLVPTGSPRTPSQAHSADISGSRIVVEVIASQADGLKPQRVESLDSGATWEKRSFGHVGARMGALRKTSPTTSLLSEAWQNNAPDLDTLRAQYETE